MKDKKEVVQIKFAVWDKTYNFSNTENIELKKGDQVIVETDLGKEIGTVVNFNNSEENRKKRNNKREKEGDENEKNENSEEIEENELKPIIRLTEPNDYNSLPDKERKAEIINYCKEAIRKYELPMKLVDVHISSSNSRFNFAFIADGRVDFRDLVKDLTIHFHTNIRLTQIGTRDEAKIDGDFGPCGRPLCCRKFIQDFCSITSDMAECQQIAHRGSDRLSGMCGRLMCCLSFEQTIYKELAEKMPPMGAKVNVDGRKGIVIGHHILKQSVDVQFPSQEKGEGREVIEVDLNRHKKKKETEDNI